MQARRLLASAAAAGLGAAAFVVLVGDHGQPAGEAAAQVLVAWTFVATGLVAWTRKPESRVGLLLASAGFALLARRFQYADDPALFTVGFALGELWNALVAHAVLAYPGGRLGSRLERVVVRLGYAICLAVPVATLAVYDPATSCLFRCGEPDRPESLLLVRANDTAFEALVHGFDIALYGVLGVAFLGLIVRKLVAATTFRRRLLAPLLVAGLAAAVRAVSEGVLTFASYSESARQVLFWWQIAVLAAVPVALVVGLLRTHLAHGAVATLLLDLERLPPTAVRDALARALRDPSVEVAFWVPDQRGYVDPAGRPVPSPTQTDERAVIHLSHEDDRIAAISHDPALGEDPELVESVAAAARLALENARLHAELRAQLAAVQESRARIAAAADAERRRIEQDLHDGAQQRLVAVALDLRAAERRVGDRIDPELRAVFRSAVDNLQKAVDELRELAHGVHPSILRQEGLGAALEALAVRAPLPVRVEAAVDGRLAPDVEAAAYFVACEALTNAVKHAGATSATVRAVRDDGFLVVEVEDDGLGGADATRGSGLRGLLDRVEAQGGNLHVVSPPGRGTRVVGRIPCGS